jgi:hypothetical protein
MNWAKDIGDEVLLWVQTLLKQKQHEEQAYRVCLGPPLCQHTCRL